MHFSRASHRVWQVLIVHSLIVKQSRAPRRLAGICSTYSVSVDDQDEWNRSRSESLAIPPAAISDVALIDVLDAGRDTFVENWFLIVRRTPSASANIVNLCGYLDFDC